MNRIKTTIVFACFLFATSAWAMDSGQHGGGGQQGGGQHGDAAQHEGGMQQGGGQSHEGMAGMQQGGGQSHEGMAGMEQGSSQTHEGMAGMEHGSASMDGKFVHSAMADDVHTEFQIMDLASMNMTDPDGKTHHVMVTFMRDDQKIEKVAGKVKLVSPSGKEQIADLKDYGGGNFAANFTIDEAGQWGVICLFKEKQGKHTVKFWYEHGQM